MNVTGSIDLGTGSLSGASGTTFDIAGGTVSTTYSGNISQGNNGALVSVAGHTTGTLLFQTGVLSSTNGNGLIFDNADGTYNFTGKLTLDGGSNGITVQDGSSGTFSFTSATSSIGATTTPTGLAFSVDGSNANVTYNGTIQQTHAAAVVSVTNETGGTVALGGAITANTSTANAINLTGNSGATINFTGGLNLTTTSGTGFNATGGGTVNATQNNTLDRQYHLQHHGDGVEHRQHHHWCERRHLPQYFRHGFERQRRHRAR
ncbi:MAG: hypothetical protein WDN28_08435 [Chthoniobacter sp.]